MHRPLSQADLLPAGPLRRLGRQVFLFSEIGSTNAFLLKQAAALQDGTLAAAEFQSAGRGRLGRRWLAPRGSSLLLSVLLLEPPDSPLRLYAGLLAALAARETIEAETDCRPTLRWPNDLMVAGRKLGGVLAESTPLPRSCARADLRLALVVGIGINCLQQRGHYPAELVPNATSLEIECRHPVDRPALCRALLRRLDAAFTQTAPGAFDWSASHAAWLAHSDDLGARVRLQQDGRTFTGTVLDIVEGGDLLVQLDQGARRRFASATTTRLR